MTEFETKTKKWGSSIGVVLPKKVVDEVGIKPNETIVIDVKKVVKVKDVFGMFPRLSKKTAQQIKDDMRAGW
ncbi:AbrB/MazE/SpoVT family DNA-binding domain-containing protein [Candidatus Woesearchaeota archaeon]|nr:AbrB/MazE/SpoVT family DNA-binding domain-containing protein [Candidatus Woesearchaeota archaeon]